MIFQDICNSYKHDRKTPLFSIGVTVNSTANIIVVLTFLNEGSTKYL